MRLLFVTRCIVLLSILVAVSCSQGREIADSPEARMEKALELARFEVAKGVLASTLDRGADLALAYTLEMLKLELGRELTTEEIGRVRHIMRDALGEVFTEEKWKANLAEVYARHFTASDLDAFLKFFQSPLGLKVVELQQTIDDEISSGGEAILEERLDEFSQMWTKHWLMSSVS